MGNVPAENRIRFRDGNTDDKSPIGRNETGQGFTVNNDDSEPNNVIAINGAVAEQLEIERKAASGNYPCIGVHKNILVDTEERTITCKACGFGVDAFEYIKQWASEGDSRMTALKNIEVRRKIAQTEHDDLMRKVKNLRQRLKRAGEPQPPKERYEYDRQRWNIR